MAKLFVDCTTRICNAISQRLALLVRALAARLVSAFDHALLVASLTTLELSALASFAFSFASLDWPKTSVSDSLFEST